MLYVYGSSNIYAKIHAQTLICTIITHYYGIATCIISLSQHYCIILSYLIVISYINSSVLRRRYSHWRASFIAVIQLLSLHHRHRSRCVIATYVRDHRKLPGGGDTCFSGARVLRTEESHSSSPPGAS